ncbi:hypothetical protein [Lactococcus lactis]|uniref:hypothetical protein n=1 Tax=Lactococcus lactis TaxID=1358 RepID=UPI0018A9F106|nr:hypothetical protein [Lactococcus lactis]
MVYTPKQWKDGDVITKEALNNIEQGIVNVPAGPKGDTGDTGAAGAKGATGNAGLSVKSLALTTTDGKVTAGTVTFSDDTTAAVTVTEA